MLAKLVLALSAAILGFFAGYLFGATRVPPGSGLAGPAIVLGYGLGGAVLGGVLAPVLARFLSTRAVRRASWTLGLIAGAATVASGISYRSYVRATYYDPPEAFTGIPELSVLLEQVVIRDPFLATRAEIDSVAGTWSVDLPDGRRCTGNLRAAAQGRVAEALAALEASYQDDVELCADEDPPDQRLVWKIADAARRTLELSQRCRNERAPVAAVIRAIRLVGQREPSQVECR